MATTYTVDLNETPVERDFTRFQGDSLIWPLTFQVNSTTTSLVGATIRYQISDKDGTTSAGPTTLAADTAASGTFTFYVSPAVTAALSAGTYTYEVEIILPASHAQVDQGATLTVLYGKLYIRTQRLVAAS